MGSQRHAPGHASRRHRHVDGVFRFILWFTTGQNRREWVAVHRKHHAFTDIERDPHRPLVHAFWKIQLWNVYYYVREARNPETLGPLAKDIRDDVWDRVLFNKAPGAGRYGLGYWWGRKNFGNNSATNLRVLAWLTGGESLHNNHHAYPSSPKFSMGRFEFDPSWVVIRVLMLLRLARLVGPVSAGPR